jgi:hypothetical protein
MQQWEYRKIKRELNLSTAPLKSRPNTGIIFIWEDIQDENDINRYADEMERLKQLGNEGWELVSVLREHSDRKFVYTYYLKRLIE